MAGIIDSLRMLLGGGAQTEQPVATTTAQDPASMSVFQNLIGGGPVDMRRAIRSFGAGAANIGDTGGDPYAAFGRGLGGATGFYQGRDDYSDKLALEKAEQDRLTAAEAQEQARWEQELEIKKAAEARQARLDEARISASGISDYDRRRSEADRMGMSENDPDYRRFVLEGKFSDRSLSGAKAPSGFRWADESMTKLEPIPGGPGEQIAGELAARIGMAENFQQQLPEIKQKVQEGLATGLIDRSIAWTGRGVQGEIDRQIASGVDALQRLLTGAGMNMSEAEAYSKRYLPKATDDIDTVLSKLDQLSGELESTKAMALRGRGGTGLSGKGSRTGKSQTGINWSLEED